MDDAREAAGITPGKPLPGGDILAAEGEIDTPAYAGHVHVITGEEWTWPLDLRVPHEVDPDFDGLDHVLADDEGFRTAVIRLLQTQNKLPPGEGFELEPADSDVQYSDLAVFERLLRNGEDVGRAAAASWGAADVVLAEAMRNLLGTAP